MSHLHNVKLMLIVMMECAGLLALFLYANVDSNLQPPQKLQQQFLKRNAHFGQVVKMILIAMEENVLI